MRGLTDTFPDDTDSGVGLLVCPHVTRQQDQCGHVQCQGQLLPIGDLTILTGDHHQQL